MPARKLSEILGDTREFESVAASARRVAQLQRIYLEAIPPTLTKSSRVSWARAGVLIVTASNGAVGSILRQVTPRVLDRFRQCGFEFNSMRIQVQVGEGLLRPPNRAGKALSPRAIAAIEKKLADVSESPLKAALRHLARHR
jgi:hypothetical protein